LYIRSSSEPDWTHGGAIGLVFTRNPARGAIAFPLPRSGALILDVGFNSRTTSKHFLVALATVESLP